MPCASAHSDSGGEYLAETIQRFLRATRPDCLRILDINLRPPFWNREIVLQSLELANMLKLNDTELAVVAGMLGWTRAHDEIAGEDHRRVLAPIGGTHSRCGWRGPQKSSGQHSDLPGQPAVVVDTVRAGDAYTAVLAIGALRGIPLEKTNAWGNRVAAFVCSQAGATPHLPDHLRQP